MASIGSPNPLSIYNVADDEPTPAYVVDEYAAKLLGMQPLPLIPFNTAVMSPMNNSFTLAIAGLVIRKLNLNCTSNFTIHRTVKV